MDNILAQSEWEDYFGNSTRVYENKHPFPGLLINYNDETDEEFHDPAWLSQVFESGFVRIIIYIYIYIYFFFFFCPSEGVHLNPLGWQ